MYQNLDLVCGGQGRVYLQRWQIFIEAFESAGIELIFVTDGVSAETKRKTWVNRKYSTLNEFVCPVFDSLVSIPV
jgi:hypothetical protein